MMLLVICPLWMIPVLEPSNLIPSSPPIMVLLSTMQLSYPPPAEEKTRGTLKMTEEFTGVHWMIQFLMVTLVAGSVPP